MNDQTRRGLLFALSSFRSGTHTPEELLIASGPGIPAGKQMDAGLMDIAPTVMHLMGAPVPGESDGKVLLELFKPGTEPRRRDVRYAPAGIGAEEGEAYSAEEQALIEKQLRDLG